MRKPIWKKDDCFDVGGQRIDMDPAIVKLPTEPVDLFWQFNHKAEPMGRVENIALEDGEILGDLIIFDEWKDPVELFFSHNECRLGGYYVNTVQRRSSDGKKIVIKAELKSVSVVLVTSMPKFLKNE